GTAEADRRTGLGRIVEGIHREDPGIERHLPVAAAKDFARSTRPGAADDARIAREIAGGPIVLERRLLLPVAYQLPHVSHHVERTPLRNACWRASRSVRKFRHRVADVARRGVVRGTGRGPLPFLVRDEALVRERARLLGLEPREARAREHSG